MTKGRVEQLKAVWELGAIFWLVLFLTTIVSSRFSWVEAAVVLGLEVIWLSFGHWIAAKDRSVRF